VRSSVTARFLCDSTCVYVASSRDDESVAAIGPQIWLRSMYLATCENQRLLSFRGFLMER